MNHLDKIRSRGFWSVVIRPGCFLDDRVAYEVLLPIVQKCVVQIRGWDFPHLSNHVDIERQADWIGQSSEWEHLLEVWRFYQSGQFVDLSGIWDDWRDQSSLSPAGGDWQPGQTLGVGDTLFRLTEIFEFAARLAQTEAGGEVTHIEIAVRKLDGRKLTVDDPNRLSFSYDRKASMKEFVKTLDLSSDELLAKTNEMAVQVARELFLRFDWAPSIQQLSDWQSKLRR